MSHIRFIHTIKEKYNIDTDIIIYTYKLNSIDDKDLLNFYKIQGINIIYSNFLDSSCSSENEFIILTYDKVNEYISNYNCCMFIRIDLYLKKYFIDNMRFNDKIQFPHFDSYNIDYEKPDKMILANVFIYFPKKYFYLIQNKVIYPIPITISVHHHYNTLSNSGISRSEIDCIVNTVHICSTDIASNPLYCQVGRTYVTNYLYFDHIYQVYYLYDKTLNHLIYDKETVILKWTEYDNYNAEDDKILLRICY